MVKRKKRKRETARGSEGARLAAPPESSPAPATERVANGCVLEGGSEPVARELVGRWEGPMEWLLKYTPLVVVVAGLGYRGWSAMLQRFAEELLERKWHLRKWLLLLGECDTSDWTDLWSHHPLQACWSTLSKQDSLSLSLTLFHRSPDSHALSSRSLVVFAPFLTTFATGSLSALNFSSSDSSSSASRRHTVPCVCVCCFFSFSLSPLAGLRAIALADTLRSSVSWHQVKRTKYIAPLSTNSTVCVCVSVNDSVLRLMKDWRKHPWRTASRDSRLDHQSSCNHPWFWPREPLRPAIATHSCSPSGPSECFHFPIHSHRAIDAADLAAALLLQKRLFPKFSRSNATVFVFFVLHHRAGTGLKSQRQCHVRESKVPNKFLRHWHSESAGWNCRIASSSSTETLFNRRLGSAAQRCRFLLAVEFRQ